VITRAAPREHYPWIVERCSLSITPQFRAVEAVGADGKILAMVGYDLWTENAVQMHVAVDDPRVFLSRTFLHAGFDYPFNQAKRGLVYTVTPGDNHRSADFQAGLGFTVVHHLPDGWARGISLVFRVMRREDCAWLHRPPARKAA
jgi:hypothetical protein